MKGMSVEVTAHVLNLLEVSLAPAASPDAGIAQSIARNGIAACSAAEATQVTASMASPGLEAASATSADLPARVLRHVLGLYRISLAGPAPGVDYSLASAACREVRQAFQQSRLADFEMAAPSSPPAQRSIERPHTSYQGKRWSSEGEQIEGFLYLQDPA